VPVTVAIDWDALRTALGAATLDYGQLINAATARRLACDGKLIPAVLGGDSEPLDVGRAMPDPPTQPRRCARPSGPCSVAPGQRGRRCLLVAGQWRHHACRGRTTGPDCDRLAHCADWHNVIKILPAATSRHATALVSPCFSAWPR
jgi:hypothetical protein